MEIRDLDAEAANAGVATATEQEPVVNSDAAFDNSQYDDPSMIVNAVKNVEEESDEKQPRFGISLLLPIPLYRQNGNNSYCDVNRKDPITGANKVNYNYYPPFRILPLVGGTFNIPTENLPDIGAEITQPAEFDVNSFQTTPRPSRNTIERFAKECSEIFITETGESGSFILHSLTGFHQYDSDKGAKAAYDMLELFLPIRDANKLPVTQRVRAGVLFTGPFLDEINTYVRENGKRLIAESSLSDADKLTAERVLVELKQHLQSAISKATQWVNETEAEIRDPNAIKKSYDIPNLDTPDSPVPVDLYCLAHLNRTELDNQQIEASGVIGSTIANPMVDAVHEMKRAVDKLTERPATVPTEGILTMDDVQKLLDAQAERLTQQFEERMAQTTAPAVPAATETVDDTTAKKKASKAANE